MAAQSKRREDAESGRRRTQSQSGERTLSLQEEKDAVQGGRSSRLAEKTLFEGQKDADQA